jgi:hypothetical protein
MVVVGPVKGVDVRPEDLVRRAAAAKLLDSVSGVRLRSVVHGHVALCLTQKLIELDKTFEPVVDDHAGAWPVGSFIRTVLPVSRLGLRCGKIFCAAWWNAEADSGFVKCARNAWSVTP